jgi:group I intron endonuclease
MTGIYKITNPNGKVYIGQSVNAKKRILNYKRLDCKEQPKIYNSLKKYGIQNHTFEIIHICNIEELNNLERYYQELYDVIKNGLNCRLTITSDKSGRISEETKLKMSIAQKGRIVSAESKLKMSINRKGTRLGIENTFFNKNHSDSSKLKMSNLRKGKRLGLDNPTSKIILDLNTGVFYYSVNDLKKVTNYSKGYLSEILRGSKPNKTQFIYI